MKKILTILLFTSLSALSPASAIAKPAFYGVIIGSGVHDYYPNAAIQEVYSYATTVSSGIFEADIVDRFQLNSSNLYDGAKKFAEEKCKNSKGYFLDNYREEMLTVGSQYNVVTSVYTNAVCIKE